MPSLYCVIVNSEVRPQHSDEWTYITPNIQAYCKSIQAAKKKLRELVDVWLSEQNLRTKYLGFEIIDHDDRYYKINAWYEDTDIKMMFSIGRVMARDDS